METGGVVHLVRRPRWWAMVGGLAALLVAIMGIGIEEAIFATIGGVVAATVSHRLAPPGRRDFKAAAFFRFLPYFATLSIRGGIDVARRALAPSICLQPVMVKYSLRVEGEGRAAVFFAAVISLIPGTLCVEICEGSELLIHVLDRRSSYDTELRRLEGRIAAVFGEDLGEPGR